MLVKITDVETYALIWPTFEKPFWMSIAPIGNVSELVVKVHTDDGIVGIGEGHGGQLVGIVGDYTKRVTGAAAIINEGLKKLLIGEDPLRNDYLWEKMFRETYKVGWSIPGWPRPQMMTAIGTVDAALWDIKGKAAGMPVWKLLGGSRDRVPCYVTGGYYQEGKTTSDLVKECE